MEAACASRVTIRRSAVADAQAGLASHVVGVSRQEDSSDLANVYSPVLNLLKSCTAVQPEPIGDLGAERKLVLRDQERELAQTLCGLHRDQETRRRVRRRRARRNRGHHPA